MIKLIALNLLKSVSELGSHRGSSPLLTIDTLCIKLSNYLTLTMWYVVQQQPGETIALSNHPDYDSAKFKLMNTQRFDSKKFYEILHSSDIVDLNR